MATQAWVVSAAESAESNLVDLELLIPPRSAYRLSPSAMLDYTREDKGYDAAGPYIYLLEHGFSQAADVLDVSWRAAGHKIRIIDADVADPASPVTATLTVTAVLGNRLTLSGTFASFSTARRYIVESDDYATCNTAGQAAQLAFAFIGDDGDEYIQDLAAARPWVRALPAGTSVAPDGTTGFMRPPNLADDEGEPLSAHKVYALAAAVNNLKAHVANQHPICQQFVSPRTTTASSYEWMAGPYAVHWPPDATALTMRLLAKATVGHATFRATAGRALPGGTAPALSFGAEVVQVTGSTTGSSVEEITLTLPLWPSPTRECWVSLEARNSTAATASLYGVSGYAAAIGL